MTLMSNLTAILIVYFVLLRGKATDFAPFLLLLSLHNTYVSYGRTRNTHVEMANESKIAD